jgi:hypothetical protein
MPHGIKSTELNMRGTDRMRSKFGLKTLGLFALLVAMMAISASGAQAATPEWMKNGADIGVAEPEITASLENNDATLLTTINGLSIDILCTAGNFVGAKLKAGGTTNSTTVKFTGCKIYKLEGGVKTELACHVHSNLQPEGTIETKIGHGQLELHTGGVPITLVIPNVGTEFARILTEKCVLPELIPVIGKLALKDCENKAETEQAIHLVEEFEPLSELFVINTTEMEHLAHLDGSANVSLVGGGNFSGLAG